MRTRRLLMPVVLVMSVFAAIAPQVNMMPRADTALPDFKRQGLRDNFKLAETDITTHGGPTPDTLIKPSEAGEPQFLPDRINPELLDKLGIKKLARGGKTRKADGQGVKSKPQASRNSQLRPQSGQPQVLDESSALSAALITSIGGRDNQFSEVTLLADWDGREDCVADRESKVTDLSGAETEIDEMTTRVAISEHTIANGFAKNIFYRGDSTGCFTIFCRFRGSPFEECFKLCFPELVNNGLSGGFALLNAIASDCMDDQATVTGIAVNPVSDLADFGLCGALGEVVYVSVLDTEGCASNASGQPFRTRIFCIGLADCRTVCGTVTAFTPATPTSGGSVVIGGVQTFFIGPGVTLGNQGLITVGANICLCAVSTTAGQFAVGSVSTAPAIAPELAPVGVRQILRSPLSNIAGVAVDDDSNLYFQLVDLINLQNGGAIFKVTETPRVVAGCGPSPRINRVIASIPNGLTGDIALGTAVGSTANPALTSGGFRLTNYSGQSLTFGNIVSLATGQSNVLYAAVARSFNPADNPGTQATEGAFPSPAALGPTPSMIISFADCGGGFDSCTSPAPGLPGTLPVADGFADVAQSGLTRIPGVNNFRVFALGDGPDIRPATGGTAVVPGTPATVLKVDMQIDFSVHSGIAVNEEGTVFVISGGTPAGVGKNPSPMLGEILCFEDNCPMDRRADFIDFRGDVLPNPPASGGNTGDGDSDRFDHIFHQAPLDSATFTPAGLAGLARGFLRYTNRLAPNPISPGVTLGVIGGQTVQGDDDTSGPIIFENLDPGHQVAGGDDQNPPFTGDDNDGVANPNNANNPVLVGPLSGGFEFLFGAAGVPGSATTPCINNVWNAFFLNSNGNITFNGGDRGDTPTVIEFRSGLPKVAPAWADLNPNARSVNPINFPVQSLGFANVNAFKVRWLNVPEFGREGCSTNAFGLGGNTFAVTLYDDGMELDENVPQPPAASSTCREDLITCLRDEFTLEDVCLDLHRVCRRIRGEVIEGPTAFRFTTVFDGLFSGAVTGDCDNSGLGGICVDNGCRRKSGNKAACDTQTCGCANKDVVACTPFPPDTGPFLFSYSRMDLLGTPERPVITGYSEGGTSPLNPPGLCETNLSLAAASADSAPFGVINGQIASIEACLIGEGTEPHIFELFNEGRDASIGADGDIILATPDFDLRFEGNDPRLCISVRQRDLNRGKVGFFGKTCPVSPIEISVRPRDLLVVSPGQPAKIINAVCSVQLSVAGCGFFPNETTTICPSFNAETGVPLQRPGKTVSTSAAIACDTNGDGTPDATVQLTNVTPVNRNLVRVTLPALSGSGLPGTPFPLACCGGLASLTLTTTFTAGDNNQFGAFTRTTTLPIDLGVRAPVVLSVSPSDGDCSVPQDLLVTGACFITPQGSVTGLFAVERNNPSNVIQATKLAVLSPNLIDAFFDFGSANAGKTFLIFATGPGGTSRNLTMLPQGASPGCPLGNEQGVQVAFTCEQAPPQPDLPIVTASRLERSPSGSFSLVVSGRNFQRGATVTVGGKPPRKVQFKDPQTGSNTYDRLVLKGKICAGLPGVIVVTNPGGKSSAPFRHGESCSAQD